MKDSVLDIICSYDGTTTSKEMGIGFFKIYPQLTDPNDNRRFFDSYKEEMIRAIRNVVGNGFVVHKPKDNPTGTTYFLITDLGELHRNRN